MKFIPNLKKKKKKIKYSIINYFIVYINLLLYL